MPAPGGRPGRRSPFLAHEWLLGNHYGARKPDPAHRRLALGGLVAAGCGGGDETNTRAAPVGEQAAAGAAVDAGGYAWVSDGRVTVVRRGPVTDRAYGAHGVDYSPGTSCDAARGR